MMDRFSIAPTTLNEIFDREMNEVRWLAEVILGDGQTAESCIASARCRADGSSYIAPDWRVLWIKRCVVHEAVDLRRPEIARSRSNRHPGPPNCSLALDKTALRRLRPSEISAVVDAFERAALILHFYLGFSVHDCALLLDCHWSSIEPACAAATWQLLGPRLPAGQQAAATRPLEVLA